jgi:hypothetical protein
VTTPCRGALVRSGSDDAQLATSSSDTPTACWTKPDPLDVFSEVANSQSASSCPPLRVPHTLRWRPPFAWMRITLSHEHDQSNRMANGAVCTSQLALRSIDRESRGQRAGQLVCSKVLEMFERVGYLPVPTGGEELAARQSGMVPSGGGPRRA